MCIVHFWGSVCRLNASGEAIAGKLAAACNDHGILSSLLVWACALPRHSADIFSNNLLLHLMRKYRENLASCEFPLAKIVVLSLEPTRINHFSPYFALILFYKS